jgi:glycine/D-amino acid oxidase-like deaminating enzyme
MKVNEAILAEMGKTHVSSFEKRYPDLHHVAQEYVWAGRLCLSRNGVSAFGELEKGLYSACCQNGLGVARGTLSGMSVAELASEGETDLAKAFLSEDKPQQLPFKPLDSIGAKAFMRWSEYKARHEL